MREAREGPEQDGAVVDISLQHGACRRRASLGYIESAYLLQFPGKRAPGEIIQGAGCVPHGMLRPVRRDSGNVDNVRSHVLYPSQSTQ